MEKILNVKELLGDFSRGLFVERPNRFVGLVSVKGKIFKAHISDTGRLKELLIPETPVILANNERGKLDYKLVAVLNDGTWVFLNTSLHSKIAQKVIEKGLLGFIPEEIKREVKWRNSRIDFLVDGKFYIEVKGCNLEKRNICLFPDAPTARGRKHLEDLIELREKGFETAVLFLVFRKCECFKPHEVQDPKFAKTFKLALEKGVKFYAFKLSFCPESGWIYFEKEIALC
ncbi:MAG: DNA/RNA nuclease SfsA [Desulfurobacteriaceae bacterium]